MTFDLANFTGDSAFPFFIQYGHHDFSNDMHDHKDFHELTIVLDGTALHIINGESYFIKKGDVFCVNDRSEHCFTQCQSFRICNIMFRTDEMFAPFKDLKDCNGFNALFYDRSAEPVFKSRLRLNINDFEECERLIAKMIEEYQGCQAGFSSTVTAYFIQLVSYLVRRYDDEQSAASCVTTFSKAVAHIERSFTQKMTIEEIANIAGMSVRHFQRQFKSTYLITPQEYIVMLRMQKAIQMLLHTDSNITEIAMECGYQDPNLFSRQFRKNTGLSPRRYRRDFTGTIQKE